MYQGAWPGRVRWCQTRSHFVLYSDLLYSILSSCSDIRCVLWKMKVMGCRTRSAVLLLVALTLDISWALKNTNKHSRRDEKERVRGDEGMRQATVRMGGITGNRYIEEGTRPGRGGGRRLQAPTSSVRYTDPVLGLPSTADNTAQLLMKKKKSSKTYATATVEKTRAPMSKISKSKKGKTGKAGKASSRDDDGYYTYEPTFEPTTDDGYPDIEPTTEPTKRGGFIPEGTGPPEPAPPEPEPAPPMKPTADIIVSTMEPTSEPESTMVPTIEPLFTIEPTTVPTSLGEVIPGVPTTTTGPTPISLMFGVTYNLAADVADPTDQDFLEASDVTYDFVSDFFTLAFGSTTVQMETFEGAVLRNSGSSDPCLIDYEIELSFEGDPSSWPTTMDIDLLLRLAFEQPTVTRLLVQLNALSSDNPFSTTTDVIAGSPSEGTVEASLFAVTYILDSTLWRPSSDEFSAAARVTLAYLESVFRETFGGNVATVGQLVGSAASGSDNPAAIIYDINVRFIQSSSQVLPTTQIIDQLI
jgi:hypothetical protein